MRTDRWLAAALYDQDHGYYSSSHARPGAKSDFMTPVTLGGGTLGGILGRWAGGVGVPAVVEVGGGDGRLASRFVEACHVPYAVVDWGVGEGPGWRRHAPGDPPAPTPGALLLAVEVLDAMPVRRFRPAVGGWEEEWWRADEAGEWAADWLPVDGPCPASALPPAEAGDGVVEVPVGLEEALAGWASLAPGGRALFIDYGSAGPTGDSLRGFSRHRLLEPLSAPGAVDWTATVRWPTVQRAMERCGFCDVEVLPLGIYLAGLGEEAVFGGGEGHRERLAVKELLSPLGMGESFQALTASVSGTPRP